MKPIVPLFVILAYVAQFIHATPTAADIAAANALCVSNFGSGYTAKFDANDNPVGCDPPPIKPCFYGPYTNPLTGAAGCCGVPGQTYMTDPATKNGACCNGGEQFRWDAKQNKGFCDKIPPPKPVPAPISCPASNLADKQVGSIVFRTFCNRAVQRVVPLYMALSEWNRLRNLPPTPGITTPELCVQACASNPQCQGANWIINSKACALNTYGPGLYGNLYKLPPIQAPADVPIIAFQSIPRRAGT